MSNTDMATQVEAFIRANIPEANKMKNAEIALKMGIPASHTSSVLTKLMNRKTPGLHRENVGSERAPIFVYWYDINRPLPVMENPVVRTSMTSTTPAEDKDHIYTTIKDRVYDFLKSNTSPEKRMLVKTMAKHLKMKPASLTSLLLYMIRAKMPGLHRKEVTKHMGRSQYQYWYDIQTPVTHDIPIRHPRTVMVEPVAQPAQPVAVEPPVKDTKAVTDSDFSEQLIKEVNVFADLMIDMVAPVFKRAIVSRMKSEMVSALQEVKQLLPAKIQELEGQLAKPVPVDKKNSVVEQKRVLVVGLEEKNHRFLMDRFANRVKLKMLPADNPNRLIDATKYADFIILNASRCGHKHRDVLTTYGGVDKFRDVHGGFTSIADEIEAYLQKCS